MHLLQCHLIQYFNENLKVFIVGISDGTPKMPLKRSLPTNAIMPL